MVSSVLRFLGFLLASLASLVIGLFIAVRLEDPERLIAAALAFLAYLFLFGAGLNSLRIDWDGWRNRPRLRDPIEKRRQEGPLAFAAPLALVLGTLAPKLVAQGPPAPPKAATPTPAPTPAVTPWYDAIAVNGFVSAGYAYNANRPASGTNQFRVFDFDDNSIKVDVAELVIQKAVSKPGEAGFRVDAVAGGSIPRVSAAAGLFRDASGKAQDFDLQQAFVSYVAPLGSGLRLDFGKFITHMGNELIEGYDGWNDNATRSLVFGYAIPFTHTGLKASYTFNDELAGMLQLCNGWDVVKDNNSGKSLGVQLVWTPSKAVAVTGNYMVGPERADSNSDLRNVGNLVGQWKATAQTVFTLELTYGSEPNAVTAGQTATWRGIVGYARFGFSDSLALILRGEFFDDHDGARTGVRQYLKEVTLTPEWKISPHFLVRGDLRVDWSNQDVFEKSSGFTSTQPTILVDAIYVF
jgi:hypothetical protein